jgi:hypothetical protein
LEVLLRTAYYGLEGCLLVFLGCDEVFHALVDGLVDSLVDFDASDARDAFDQLEVLGVCGANAIMIAL